MTEPFLSRLLLSGVGLLLAACGDASTSSAGPLTDPAGQPGKGTAPSPSAAPSATPEAGPRGRSAVPPPGSTEVALGGAFVRVAEARCTSGASGVGSFVEATLAPGKYQFSACTLRLTPAEGVRDVSVSLARAPDAPDGDPWTVTRSEDGGDLVVRFARRTGTFERAPLELLFAFSRGAQKEHAFLTLEAASPLELARFDAPRLVKEERYPEIAGNVTTEVRRPVRVDRNGTVVLRPSEKLLVELPYELLPGVRAASVMAHWDAAVWPAVPFERCLLGEIQQRPQSYSERGLALSGPYTGAGVIQLEAGGGAPCETVPLVAPAVARGTLYGLLTGLGYGWPEAGDFTAIIAPAALDEEVTVRQVDGGIAVTNRSEHTLVGLKPWLFAPCDPVLVATLEAKPRPTTTPGVRAHKALEPGGEAVWTVDEIRTALSRSCTSYRVARVAIVEGWDGSARTAPIDLPVPLTP